ncbi:hypothetical protein GWI33_011918 [Rhynchophorus ferrugineus]|uniref:Uncharacterized protein n=1 Tax=Rhynchophorus ferrugineus TaxID=354439 RepID=A0A834IU48_RHYFE|nr:hypothetical protein GWI33_011918 [Rhynchophorus ferrugineus]
MGRQGVMFEISNFSENTPNLPPHSETRTSVTLQLSPFRLITMTRKGWRRRIPTRNKIDDRDEKMRNHFTARIPNASPRRHQNWFSGR